MPEGLILIYGAAAGAPLLLVGVLIWSGLARYPASRAKLRTIALRRAEWEAARALPWPLVPVLDGGSRNAA